MTTVPAKFTIKQSDGTIERIDLYDGSRNLVVRLEFEGDAPITRQIEAGRSYVVICYLIGKHGDTLQIDWTIGGITAPLIKFDLHKGALSTRELPGGKLLGVGFTTFDAPEA